MSFSTNGQDLKSGGQSKSFNAGVVFAHVYDATVRTSSTGKKALQLTLEGPAIPNFEGWDIDRNDASKGKYQGQTAIVSGSVYVADNVYNNTDVNENPIMNKFVVIATELGLREDLDKITATSIEDWVVKATNLVKGKNLHFFLAGSEEVYNDKTRVKLNLPRYKFAAADASKLDTFDKTKKYHYKALESSVKKEEINEFEVAASSAEGLFDV